MNTPPLPDPNTDANSLIFKISFWLFYVTCVLLTLALSLLLLAPLIIYSGYTWLILTTGVGCIFIGPFQTYISMHIYPTVINANTIRGYNVWGKTALVKWNEISSVKSVRILTLTYLKISTPQKKNVIWLPLFLSDMNGFRAAVAQFAAPDNPLNLELKI